MPQVGSILSNVRKLFGDPDRDFITDAVGLDWVDQAQRRFCHKVLPLDEIKDYAVTAKANKFDLPTNAIIPVAVMWYQARTARLNYAPPDHWYQLEEAHPNSTGSPEWYTVLRQQLVVGPQVPSTASKTALASGAMTAAVTTLNLSAASGTFRTKGFGKIESEVVEWTGVATTTLTGVTRGVHGTTAASHASGTTFTQMDILMTYRKTPAAAATASNPDVPEMFHDYIEKYVLYLAWLARGDQSKAAAAFQEFEALEGDAIKTVGRRSMDGLMRIRDKKSRWRGW